MAHYTTALSASQSSGLLFGTTNYALASSLATGAILAEVSGGIAGLVGSAAGSALLWDGVSAFQDSSRAWALATTSTIGIQLANTTAATVGTTIQYSPALSLVGSAWDTDGAVSVTERWRIENRPVNGNTVTSALHFLRAQDAGAFTSVVNITSSGSVFANGILRSNSSFIISGNENIASGIGVTDNIYNVGARPILLRSTTTDAASATCIAVCYDRNAASVTNAATMRLTSFGWTNNSDVYAELAAVYCDGAVEGVGLRAKGDLGAGVASTTTITNATVADGASDATLGKAPAAAARSGWLKIYVGTTAVCVPYWAAA
jgi:hypothetical protein